MNKIVLAQINPISGNINYNLEKIENCIKKAKEDNADLVVFPALALTGFPFEDILKRHKSIYKRQLDALNKIAKDAQNITVVLGFVNSENKSDAAVIQNGKVVFTRFITLNNEKFEIITDNKNITLSADTVIHIAADASRLGKEYTKNKLFSSFAKKHNVNYIYVNQAGYSDNFCFDGTSRTYNHLGELTSRANAFKEDYISDNTIKPLPFGMEKEVDINLFNLNYENDLERTYKSIVFSIREYFSKNGFKKAVLGLSGGLDSTVCAVLLSDALGKENVFAISMPSKITSNESKNDAKILAQNLGINFFEIPLASEIDSMKNLLKTVFNQVNAEKYDCSTTIENLQARLRATILWSVSNEHKNMLPIATSDKSEAYIGYATINGDMSGGFAPIADVTKTKLFALADFLNKHRKEKNAIPQSILEKPPGAELKINPITGKTVCAEEDNMPYEFLDEIIWFVENHGYGFDDLVNHNFYYEKHHALSQEQKNEWIKKFFWKSHCAVYKWHILPASVITDMHSINSADYRHPILSKIY